MPYSYPDNVPTALKNQSAAVKRKWIRYFNEEWKRCKASGGSDSSCETKARKAAWARLKQNYYKDPKDGKWKPKKKAYSLTQNRYEPWHDLPVNVEDLPAEGRALWRSVYNDRVAFGASRDAAKDEAWAAVQERFEQDSEEEWRMKNVDDLDVEKGLVHNSTLAKKEPTWGGVNKNKLPRKAHARMGDASKPSTWGFPHHWVQNGSGTDKNGRFTSGSMFLHRGGLRTAWSAAHGGRSGKVAEAGVLSHLNAHRKAIDMGDDKALMSLVGEFKTELNSMFPQFTRGFGEYVGDGVRVRSDFEFCTDKLSLSKRTSNDGTPQYYLSGEASNTKLDKHGHRIDKDFIEKMQLTGKGLTIFKEHSHIIDNTLGTIVDVGGTRERFDIEALLEPPYDKDKDYGNKEVTQILQKMSWGTDLAFSIGGRVTKVEFIEDEEKEEFYLLIKDGELYEVSVVALPAGRVSPIRAMLKSLDLTERGLDNFDDGDEGVAFSELMSKGPRIRKHAVDDAIDRHDLDTLIEESIGLFGEYLDQVSNYCVTEKEIREFSAQLIDVLAEFISKIHEGAATEIDEIARFMSRGGENR